MGNGTGCDQWGLSDRGLNTTMPRLNYIKYGFLLYKIMRDLSLIIERQNFWVLFKLVLFYSLAVSGLLLPKIVSFLLWYFILRLKRSNFKLINFILVTSDFLCIHKETYVHCWTKGYPIIKILHC